MRLRKSQFYLNISLSKNINFYIEEKRPGRTPEYYHTKETFG
jgi:hypothetical protein